VTKREIEPMPEEREILEKSIVNESLRVFAAQVVK
jgi:hypothetical protein